MDTHSDGMRESQEKKGSGIAKLVVRLDYLFLAYGMASEG